MQGRQIRPRNSRQAAQILLVEPSLRDFLGQDWVKKGSNVDIHWEGLTYSSIPSSISSYPQFTVKLIGDAHNLAS